MSGPRSTEPDHPAGWLIPDLVTVRDAGGEDARVAVLRKLLSSLAVVAAAAGLVAFATLGAFDNHQDPFPHSLLSH